MHLLALSFWVFLFFFTPALSTHGSLSVKSGPICCTAAPKQQVGACCPSVVPKTYIYDLPWAALVASFTIQPSGKSRASLEHSLLAILTKLVYLNKMDQPNLGHHVTHDPTNVGILSAPHGPETGDDHVHLQGRAPDEEDTSVLKQLIYPNDTYTPEGVYWADLPLGKQLAFNAAIDNAEAKKELSSIWQMMKKDPLSPIGWYFRNAVLPGAGLGLEG